MATQLERTIMGEIGFRQHFSHYNGGGDCEQIRTDAADRLAGAIQSHHDAGDSIAPPDELLMQLLKDVARREAPNWVTRTWQAASEIIEAHMRVFGADSNERADDLGDVATYVRESFM